MVNQIATRFIKVTAIIFLVLATAIAVIEYRKPSATYWWRKVAESALTKFSEITDRPAGLSASKLAFKLRQGEASSVTVRQLAKAAERNGYGPLSSVARIHLARMSGISGEEALQLVQEAFELTGNELTAWQYAAHLRRANRPVPGEVISVLLSGADWEYAHMMRIDSRPGAISASVKASLGRINDPELFQLADSAAQSEAEYAYWSRPDVQTQAIRDLEATWLQVAPLARRHRGWNWIATVSGDFLKRTAEGFIKLFTAPGPVEIGSVVSRVGRRFMGTIDALEAIGTAESSDQAILKAREALGVLEKQLHDLRSGEMVGALEEDVTKARNAVIARLDVLLSDPGRYWLSESLVLAAMESKDANELFLSEVARREVIRLLGGHTPESALS